MRRHEMSAALKQWEGAAARTTTPKELYSSVAASLRDAGFLASIYTVEGEWARLIETTFAEQTVRIVERHTSLRVSDFKVMLADVPFFRRVLSAREALVFDTDQVLRELFPANAKWFAAVTTRVIKIRKCIGASVRDERNQPVAMLFVLGSELTPKDLATASDLVSLMGVTLGRLRANDTGVVKSDAHH
jgi:hypothetical protein